MSRSRIVGIDLARCLALLGMMATHILATVVDLDATDGAAGRVPLYQQAVIGRSSALFAVLAGVSLVLVMGRAPARTQYAGLVTRAVLIVAIGLALGELATSIAVILTYYGVFFVAAAPFLRLSTPRLVTLTIGWLALAPLVSHGLRIRMPAASYEVPSFSQLLQHPLAMGRELVVTGYYPALTWLPYLLVGMVLARLDLRSGVVRLRLVAGGVAAALVGHLVADLALGSRATRTALTDSFEGPGWLGSLDLTLTHGLFGVTPATDLRWLWVVAPHSGTTWDLLATIGSAMAVLGVCLALSDLVPQVRIAAGIGTMTLSGYSAHLVMSQRGWWDNADVSTYLGQVAVLLIVGAALTAAGLRGPLEAAVSGVARLVAAGVSRTERRAR